MSLQNPPISLPSVSIGRPQIVASPTPAVAATPGKVWPTPEPPNHAMFASCGCVAQNPCVRVTPWPVFSKTQVTVSPFFRLIVAVCVLRSPTPVLPPLPVTVQLYRALGSVDPPIPVNTQPSGTSSFTVYDPAFNVCVFDCPPASEKPA